MKYYYKGKLVRTSDNNYRYASVWETEESFKVCSCSSTWMGANKRITEEINSTLRGIDYYTIYLDAIIEGKEYFCYKNKTKKVVEERERVEQYLNYEKERLEKQRKYYKVVELEVK